MADTTASAKIIKAYKINRFPSFIFLDSKSGFMFTDIAYLGWPKPLLEIAQRAISASKEKSMFEYDSAYAAGNTATEFLKEYISRRIKAGITTNAELIEKYVYGLKISDFYNYDEVLFILKAGPIVEGNAFRLARLNRPLIDSIYKTEPLSVRVAFNNATIANTMSSAVSGKNFSLAMAAANFTRSTWSDNPAEGQKNYSLKLVQYYHGVKDTMKYLQHASGYYEQYYMRLTVDSVRRRDSINLVNARKGALDQSRRNAIDSAMRRSFSFTYAKDVYANELNTAARNFYYMAKNRTDYLIKAVFWIRRAIELTPQPTFYDTYAHLLYRMKFFDEAESAEKKAIESAKTGKKDYIFFEKELEKIRARTL